MANANVAFGFKPVGKHGSSPATQGTSQYFIASDASAIFQGSPVKAELTGGTIQIGSASGNGDQQMDAEERRVKLGILGNPSEEEE